MRYFVYVLGCFHKGRRLTYVGWTNDVARRLAQHNAGTGARSTRGRCWTLLHTEELQSRSEAMSREWHLKRDRNLRKQLHRASGVIEEQPLPRIAMVRPRAG
jgi:putative endonuclease